MDVFNTFLRLLRLLFDLKVIVQIANFVGELAILDGYKCYFGIYLHSGKDFVVYLHSFC